MATLNSKKIKERSKAKEDDGEGLYVRERTDRKDSRQSRGKSRSKSQDEQPSFSGSTYDDSEVMMVMSTHALLDWIINSRCSYHMTPRYIPELKRNLISLGTLEKEGFTVKLQSGKVKMINGSRVILSGIRRDNCVYSLDGHAMACELNASVEEKDSLAQVWCRKAHYSESDRLCPIRLIRSVLGGIIRRSSTTTIEKKTPMEMWSGHPSDYEMLRIFACITYPHDKQGKLKPRAMECVLLGYLEGVKGYRLYRLNDESPIIVTSRNVVFNESVMYKDTLKDSGADADKSVEELQVEVELQMLNNHTHEEDQIDQEDAEQEDTREPLTYQEAVACEDSSKWKAAMKKKMNSLRKNTTWELVDHPAGQKRMSCKWLFKIKKGVEGVQKHRYKARLVARGFTQRAGIDYNEEFSLVVQHTSIRVILALIACKDYELEQPDVKTSPRQWYRRFDEYILSNGFKRSSYNNCVYYMSYAPGECIYLLLYVDDMLIACKSKAEIGSTKSLLKKEFDMKDLGKAKKILGMEIVRDWIRKILRVSQSRYVSKILNNFIIDNGKSVQMPLGGHFKLSLKDCPVRDCDVERMSKVPYANAVGSLMYLIVCKRPDIAYAVSVVSRYLAKPGKNHWEVVKLILIYLRGTANVGLVYGINRGNHVNVPGFVDSDYAKDPDTCRSITGYVFLVQGCVVSWKATLQHVVAFSTTEAEYMAFTEAVKEDIWLRGLLEELGVELNIVAVNCDNQGAIHLSRNHIFCERTKHINVRYHFIREVLEAKTVKVLKVGTERNIADALTKVVPGRKLQHCLELLNVGSLGLFVLRPNPLVFTAVLGLVRVGLFSLPHLYKRRLKFRF
uniref:Retrotransposon protein, putative, Ty1-copia subclass n=1 Tax=Tanacetum cinerariifolium TaxID=118510 RepID=A0A699IQP9_TANCI|nr:retrotransposon protein, putative, Ty1-copia subclass [Tanacetum cinerariifolium]